jgi:hypothetical protein
MRFGGAVGMWWSADTDEACRRGISSGKQGSYSSQAKHARCTEVCRGTSTARPSQSPDLLYRTSSRLHSCAVLVALLRFNIPKTLPWDLCASLSGAKRDSGRRRPALIDSRTLRMPVSIVLNMFCTDRDSRTMQPQPAQWEL